MRHKLSSVDLENKTAMCAVCGFTKIIKSPASNPQCTTARNTAQRKRYYKKYPMLTHERTKVCDICKKQAKTVYDHDHTSGRHRGWLCHNCNVGLGLFKDNVVTLKSAINYLQT